MFALRLPTRISTSTSTRTAAVLLLAAALGCGTPSNPNRPPGGGGGGQDAGVDSPVEPACDPDADSDNDCITDGLEGCLTHVFLDTDDDGFPDWSDPDADNDGIPDTIEAGNCAQPRDTDRDGFPDFQDHDSDNDGAGDEFEDRNGDGMVGTCATACSDTSECDVGANERCSIPVHGGVGVCVSVTCLGGETDPRNNDTDGDGHPDGLEGTFICNPPSPINPNGLRRLVYADSVDTSHPESNWRVALAPGTFEGEPTLTDGSGLEGIYTFDMPSPSVEVAGFLVARAPLDPGGDGTSAIEEAQAALPLLQASPAIGGIVIRVSGTNITSLDGFDTVVSTTLELSTTAPTTVTELREALSRALLERDDTQLVFPEPGWSPGDDTRFIMVVQTVFRVGPEIPSQTIYTGALARLTHYDDRGRATAIHADDMANGTGHSVSGNGEAVECEQFFADRQATADIVWVVDQSGSVDDDRQRVGLAAALFFESALNAGLDFRMGVTDMNDTGPGNQPGIFASRQTGGTGDRWLLPSDVVEFIENINDPSGPDPLDGALEDGLIQARSTIARHTPRDNADPQMVRERAQLVIIFVTDEMDQSVKDEGLISGTNPTPQQLAAVTAFVGEHYLPQLIDEQATAHLIGRAPPINQSDCTFEPSYGYYDMVNASGGQIGSICQDNLSPTIDSIIDSIISDASPITLSLFPISASIAVARDNEAVPRSRSLGWDYRGAANSIIFFGMPFDPANPSDVVVSYRRWAEQVPIE